MSRPKHARLVFFFDPATLASAMRYLRLKRPCDAVLAALLLHIVRESGRETGLPVFIDRRDPDWRENARQALAAGCPVAMEHRGRLRRYKPGTIAGEKLRLCLGRDRRSQVWALARFVWANKGDAYAFLSTPHPQLRGQSPADVAVTTEGARRVTELLWQIFYGLPQ